MPTYRITTPDGQKFEVTAPDGVPEDKVLATVQEQAKGLGMYQAEQLAQPQEHPWVKFNRESREAFGPGGYEQGKTIPGSENLPHPADVLGTTASLALTGPGGGLAAKAVPQIPRIAGAVGRVLTQGAIGAGEAALKDKSATKGAEADVINAGLTEGALGLIGVAKIPRWTKSIKEIADEFGSRTKAYEWATRAIGEAFDKIKDRIPKGRFMNVPNIDPTRRINPKEAMAGLEKLEGVEYDVARRQIISELNALDIRNVPKKMLGGARKTPGPYAGSEFEARTAGKGSAVSPVNRQKPTESSGEKAARAFQSPGTAVAADTATRQRVGGVPFGTLAAAAGMQSAPVLKHIPGARFVEEAVEGE